MAAWGKLAFGTMLIVLIGVAASTMDAFPGSLFSAQQRLQLNAEAALADADVYWPQVHVDGQKAVLTGIAPSERARTDAVDTVSGTAWRGGLLFGGVTTIDVSATTIAAPPPEDITLPVLTAKVEDIPPTIPPTISSAQSIKAAEQEPAAVEEAEDLIAAILSAEEETIDENAPSLPVEEPAPPAAVDLCQPRLEAVIDGRNITFATARSEIDAASRAQLLDIAEVLSECSEFVLLISGHSDSRGAASRNRQLSLYRADAVATYLRSMGVTDTRLQTRGLGSSEPIASNATLEGQAQNRRIEFTLISDLPE